MSLDIGFSRWVNRTSIMGIIDETKIISEKYLMLKNLNSSEDRVLVRKTWQELSSKYWEILFAIIDAQTELMPDELVFDDEEQLFINYGYFCDAVTPIKNIRTDMIKKRDIPDIFQYQLFSDYIAECWAMIRGVNPPPVACSHSLEEKEMLLTNKLKIDMEEALKEMRRLIRFGNLMPNEIDELASNLVKFLIPAMKVKTRTKEYREATDTLRQQMNQESFRFAEAERIMETQLSIVQKNEEEPVGIPEIDEFLSQHERIKILARKIIYVQQQTSKLKRQIDRVSRSCSQFSDQMKRKELKNMITKKREYMTVPAKLARTDTSPLASYDMEPLTIDLISERMCEYSSMDMDMFQVPRVRMYGIPKVILIPGQGWGSYDWSDNSIIIPAFPVNDIDKTITYGLASFRWDSDEDRSIKNVYENNIKENKGKSIIELSTSFYKDYYIYLTKEKKGFRVLPRVTSKAFASLFSPRKEDL